MTRPESDRDGPLEFAGEKVSAQVAMISLTRLAVLGQELRIRNGGAAVSRERRPGDRALVTIRPGGPGAALPLLLVHPVGGSVMAYRELARHLSADQPVYAFENQITFQPERTLCPSVTGMAERYISELWSVQPRGPYTLGGYSMGGAVAFEMARQLSELGHAIHAVIVIDTPARVHAAIEAAPDEPMTTARLMAMAQIIGSRHAQEIDLSAEELERLPPAERLEYLVEALKRQLIVPPHVDTPLIRELLKVVRNNEEAQRAYEPGPFDGPLILIRAADPSPELQFEAGSVYDEPAFGWQSVSRRPVEVVRVPGGHLRIMNPPYVQSVGAEIQRCLDRRRPHRVPQGVAVPY